MTIVAGRQEIKLGSEWLICDGTPLDGGRTNYFDALRFTYNLDSNTTSDFILIDNHADTAKWLKPFNDRDIDLSEQDEQGAILYLNKKTMTPNNFWVRPRCGDVEKKTQLDLFLFAFIHIFPAALRPTDTRAYPSPLRWTSFTP